MTNTVEQVQWGIGRIVDGEVKWVTSVHCEDAHAARQTLADLIQRYPGTYDGSYTVIRRERTVTETPWEPR